MDSIIQAMLGRWQGRKALLYGAMLGTLPDMDVVIDYGDAVANMTQHRGFMHSLFVLRPKRCSAPRRHSTACSGA